MRLIENAIDEMVRSEVSEQSPYAFQMKKIYEFKDYLKDYLLLQYGLKNISMHHFEFILEVIIIYNKYI